MSHIRRAITHLVEGLNQNTQDLILQSWKLNTSKHSVHLNKWATHRITFHLSLPLLLMGLISCHSVTMMVTATVH